MNKDGLYLLISFAAGFLIAFLALRYSGYSEYGPGYMMGYNPYYNYGYGNNYMSQMMSRMMSGLDGKTGDNFDQTFLDEMIIHHQGAIDMAQSALKDAKHDEIKKMAQDIISAQTKEIDQMKKWQKDWYGQH